MDEITLFFYKRHLKHIKRLIENILHVLDNSDIVQKYKIDEIELLKSVLVHDQTKLKEPQLSTFIKESYSVYKTPQPPYKINRVYTNKGIVLHVLQEKHHPEYWDPDFPTNISKLILTKDQLECLVDANKMPKEFIVEMVCDWYAISREVNGNLRQWFNDTYPKRWKFNNDQLNLINDIITFFETNPLESN